MKINQSSSKLFFLFLFVTIVGCNKYERLGNQYFKNKEYAQAVINYQKVFEQDSTNTDILVKLRSAQIELDTDSIAQIDYNLFIKDFEKATSKMPKNEIAWIYKGVSYDEITSHNDAIQCYNTVLGLNPNNKFNLMYLGRNCIYRNDLDPAEKYLDHAISIDSTLYKAWYFKGLIYETRAGSYMWMKQYGRVSQIMNDFSTGKIATTAYASYLMEKARSEVVASITDDTTFTNYYRKSIPFYEKALKIYPDYYLAKIKLIDARTVIGESL